MFIGNDLCYINLIMNENYITYSYYFNIKQKFLKITKFIIKK